MNTADQHRSQGPTTGRVAWLTVSDSRTERSDASGAAGRRLIEAAGHTVVLQGLVPDEPDQVREWVLDAVASGDCDVVLVSGGTGVSSRDRTYEALAGLLEQKLDGFGELFRMLSYREIGSAAMLSRAVGGIVRGQPLFLLPGSPAAVELALRELILPELGHLLGELLRRPSA